MRKVGVTLSFVFSILILSFLSPNFTYGEIESSNELFSSSELLSNDSGLSRTSASIHPENQSSISGSSESKLETNRQIEATPLTNYSSNITIDEWKILDSTGTPLSETNPALSNKNYDFEFT